MPPESAPAPARTILHVDMDAFFVACELLRRPELRGRPVVVGGTGNRGVVAAASYEARAFGVHSALPTARARRMCPHAVFLQGDFTHYTEVSGTVMDIFGSFTPLVEPLSLDEAFLDVTGGLRLHGPGPQIAAAIRRQVHDRVGLTCSVGVAPNKFLAKLASEAAKPKATPAGPAPGRGVVVVEAGSELAFLRPLPVQALWGVGPATLAKLQRLGVRTVGDLADLAEDTVTGALGRANGRHLWRLAHAIDDRPVVPDQQPKSIGHEETFAHDLHDREALGRELVRMADGVAGRLRRHHLAGRTVTLKVRFHDFRTITRSATGPDPLDSGPAIAHAAAELLAGIDPGSGVRLLGVSVSGLAPSESRQLRFDEVGGGGWDDANQAIDRIRERYGDTAIGPAAAADASGMRVKRRGDQQWGPGSGADGPSASADV